MNERVFIDGFAGVDPYQGTAALREDARQARVAREDVPSTADVDPGRTFLDVAGDESFVNIVRGEITEGGPPPGGRTHGPGIAVLHPERQFHVSREQP